MGMILARFGGAFGDTAQDICTGVRAGDAILNTLSQTKGWDGTQYVDAGAAACSVLYPQGQQQPPIMQKPVAPPPPPPAPWYADPMTIALIAGGVLAVGIGAYALTR